MRLWQYRLPHPSIHPRYLYYASQIRLCWCGLPGIYVLRESNTILLMLASSTKSRHVLYHMTASSSENRRWRQEAIKGLAEYCDAQALLRVTWSDIKSSCKERACALANNTFFEVSIFLRHRSPTSFSRACAPVIWSLNGCFDFPDGSRYKI